jgi:hypothetical protein
LKQLQEVVGNALEDTGIGSIFLNRGSMTQHLGERINKWDCIKLKIFCIAREIVLDLRDFPHRMGEIFSSYSCDKGLITRIYRELKKLSPQRVNIPMKKWAHELNREFSKEEV